MRPIAAAHATDEPVIEADDIKVHFPIQRGLLKRGEQGQVFFSQLGQKTAEVALQLNEEDVRLLDLARLEALKVNLVPCGKVDQLFRDHSSAGG